MRHGLSKIDEMSRLSRSFWRSDEIIWAIMCQIWNFFVAYGANLPKFSDMSRQNWGVAETIFSSGASRVTVPDELIEMVQ
jgi:hypothetical protein